MPGKKWRNRRAGVYSEAGHFFFCGTSGEPGTEAFSEAEERAMPAPFASAKIQISLGPGNLPEGVRRRYGGAGLSRAPCEATARDADYGSKGRLNQARDLRPRGTG